MAHVNVSVSFNLSKDNELLDVIKDAPSTKVKQCIEFYLKYQHLIPELDNTNDLLTVLSHMATKQSELIALVNRLSERINGLQAITVNEVVDNNGDDNYNDMLNFGED